MVERLGCLGPNKIKYGVTNGHILNSMAERKKLQIELQFFFQFLV